MKDLLGTDVVECCPFCGRPNNGEARVRRCCRAAWLQDLFTKLPPSETARELQEGGPDGPESMGGVPEDEGSTPLYKGVSWAALGGGR